ncbi:hypothetical protein JCM6882_005437 [Rhodosporidiobolus microsporus]
MLDKHSPHQAGLSQPQGDRPRLSPKDRNQMESSGYFVPPTPAADHQQPAWSPFGPSDAQQPTRRAGKGAHSPGAGDDGGFAGALNGSGGGRGADGGQANPWNGAASGGGLPPSFTLSPSSSAFNGKFNALLRGPQTGIATATPLHAPSASPFFPGAPPASSAPSTSASAMPPPIPASSSSHPVPPTPGPGMTAGTHFPSSSPFKMPSTVPLAGRKLAGRPGGRPSTSPASTVNSARYTLYNPQTLFSTLLPVVQAGPSNAPDPPPLLVLDIRTHTSYLTERLSTSISICVPSTLLRRPGFGIDRVQEGLPPAEQEVFERWSSCGAIIVLDAESTSLTEGGGVASLLAKFDKAGFQGKLGWVKGGWYAVKTQLRALPPDEADRLIESGAPASETSASAPVSRQGTPSQDDSLGGSGGGSKSASLPQYGSGAGGGASSSSTAPAAGSKKHARPVLQVRDLPIAAFQLASTSAFVNSGPPTGGGGGAAGGAGGGGGKNAPLQTSTRGVFDVTLTSPSTSGGSIASLASQRPGMGKRRKSGAEGEFLPGGAFGSTSGAGGQGGGSTMPTHLGMGGGFSVGMPAHMMGGANASGPGSGHSDSAASSSARGMGAAVESQKRMSTNPFYDNIRQNQEALSLDRMLSNLTPVDLPPVPARVLSTLPPFLRSLIHLSPAARADRLARQFYELEAAERERLEGTFRWHAQQTEAEGRRARMGRGGAGGKEQEETAEAVKEREEGEKWGRFGISAGVELGNLNRFKNIFPYEHARVKLTQHSPSATDYVNASYLYLRTSSKRFIASQGPLPSTFRDFWQMCDQEQVGVIIMLTNLNEGGRDKCGRYWVEQKDGEWDVQVQGDLAHEEEERLNLRTGGAGGILGGGGAGGPGGGGGFFASFDAARISPEETKAPQTRQDSTIRRTITVQRRAGRSSSPFNFSSASSSSASASASTSSSSRPRKIRHIQYRAWPDFDIPADPADVVSLVHEVDAAQQAYMREIGWKLEEHGGLEPPILAHCSAGVGRTGVFIMVTSLLEKLRREREEERRKRRAAGGDGEDKMDIDVVPTRPPLEERVSDPETSFLSAGLSLSSLNSSSPTPSYSNSSSTSGAPTAVPSPSTAAAAAAQPSEAEHPRLPSTDAPALTQPDPVFAGVNELREQRMSMVANYRQYVCVLECVIEGAVREMRMEEEEEEGKETLADSAAGTSSRA